MTGGIDQVDQELVLLGLDGDVLKILLVLHLSEQRDGGRLDGDTTLLLVGTSVGETGTSGVGLGNDTGTLDKGVGKSRLSVIDCERVRGRLRAA